MDPDIIRPFIRMLFALDQLPRAIGTAAKDLDGRPVDVSDSQAARFCIQGVLLKANPMLTNQEFRLAMIALHMAARQTSQDNCASLFEFNDRYANDDIMMDAMVVRAMRIAHRMLHGDPGSTESPPPSWLITADQLHAVKIGPLDLVGDAANLQSPCCQEPSI